jgi:ribosomal protein S12 methylthiotransferase
MRVSLISLGCPKNLVDSEIILGNLAKANFTLTSDWKASDIVIINTCAFLKSAVTEAGKYINKALLYKKNGKIKKIIVAGCLPQRIKTDLLEKFPDIDGIVGIDNLTDISKLCFSKIPQIKVAETPKHLYNSTTPRLLTTNHYAYLKIADGCDNFCSYCLIPSIRGRFRSRKIDDIIKEAKHLARNGARPALARKGGVKELILVAQDTTLYGKDIYYRLSLARLLKNLVKIKEIKWIRILYTHPAHWTDELIEVYKENPKICRYVDLPLQHISNNILKTMNRPYDRQMVEKLLAKLRKIPDLAIRTSFIVGFPGETDKDFEELLDFVKDQKFAHLGCFKYSREQGTDAYNLPNQIPERIKKERYDIIMSTQQKISLKRMQGFIGKKVKVIIDGKSSLSVTLRRKQKGLNYVGRTEYDAPEIDGVVYISSPVTTKDFNQGDFVEVKITHAQPYALIANPLHRPKET